MWLHCRDLGIFFSFKIKALVFFFCFDWWGQMHILGVLIEMYPPTPPFPISVPVSTVKNSTAITVSRPCTLVSTKLKCLLPQWFIAQLEMFVHRVLTHINTCKHTPLRTHATHWVVLCVILGCGRPWLESVRTALCWIHWDHMFKTVWLGLPWLPYDQGHAVPTYTRRMKEKRKLGLGCAKDGLASGDRTVYLL